MAVAPPPARRKPSTRPRKREGSSGLDDSWLEERECLLKDVPLEHLTTGQVIELTHATYYGEPVKVCGRLTKLEMEHGQFYMSLRLSGTTSEAILQVHTASPSEDFVVHRCPLLCEQVETGDHYLHGLKGKLVKDISKGPEWYRNLEVVSTAKGLGEDELRELREKHRALRAPRGPGEKAEMLSEDTSSRGRKRKKSKERDKKKEKKLRKEKEKEVKEKAKPAKRRGKLDGRHPIQAAVKDVETLFAGTALDPEEKIRLRVVHRARRYMKNNRKGKSSSSHSSESKDSSSSSHRDTALQDGVFTETSKAKSIAERYPGVLSQEAIRTMRDKLLSEVGEETESTVIRPTALQYFRQHLVKKLSAPAAREMVTLSMSIDHLLRGKPAHALDIMCQRMKSVEATSSGTAWQVSQRMEIPPMENTLIAQPTELKEAQKDTYAESKATWLASLPNGGKGRGLGKGPKGDPKGKGDGKKDGKDGARTRGKEDRKESK